MLKPQQRVIVYNHGITPTASSRDKYREKQYADKEGYMRCSGCRRIMKILPNGYLSGHKSGRGPNAVPCLAKDYYGNLSQD